MNQMTSSKSTNNNEIIPERRRKYLNPGDELSAGNHQTIPEQYEFDDQKQALKKNNKNNVKLQPIDHMPTGTKLVRNSSAM